MTRKRMDLVTVDCRIARGPFSDERIFYLALADGGEYVGAASRIYCYDRQGRQLGAGEPAGERPVAGRIEARFLRAEDEAFIVSLPDGRVAAVPRRLVKSKEASPDVPVQS